MKTVWTAKRIQLPLVIMIAEKKMRNQRNGYSEATSIMLASYYSLTKRPFVSAIGDALVAGRPPGEAVAALPIG